MTEFTSILLMWVINIDRFICKPIYVTKNLIICFGAYIPETIGIFPKSGTEPKEK